MSEYPRKIEIPRGPTFELLFADSNGVRWRSGEVEGYSPNDEVAIYAATFVYVRAQKEAAYATTIEELRGRVAELEAEVDELTGGAGAETSRMRPR